MTFRQIVRSGEFEEVPPHEHDATDISGRIIASILSPKALIGLESGLGIIVAADDTPTEQRRLARFKCDAVDDDEEILEAIDAAPAGGGVVTLLPGTYRLGEQNAGAYLFELAGKSNIIIQGAGRDQTFLKPPASRSAACLWFGANGTAGATNITLRDMTLDGETATFTTGLFDEHPIHFNDADNDSNRFERLIITNWDSDTTARACSDFLGTNSRWIDCYFINNHHTALHVTSDNTVVAFCVFDGNGEGLVEEACTFGATGAGGTHGAIVFCAFNTFGNLEILGGTEAGVIRVIGNDFEITGASTGFAAIDGTGDLTGSVIAHNTIKGSGWERGITVPLGAKAEANTITGTSQEGILVEGDDSTVLNNDIFGCGQATDDTYPGIEVSATTDGANVQGNRVRHGGGAAQHKYGIEVLSGASDNLVANNDLLDSGKTGSLNDAGTGTIRHGNRGDTNSSFSHFFNLGTPSTLTISAGVVTATASYHRIDTQGGAATDDLDTINGGADGDILVLRSVASARDTTLKDGTGNLVLAGDFLLSTIADTVTLISDGTSWIELSRSDNA